MEINSIFLLNYLTLTTSCNIIAKCFHEQYTNGGLVPSKALPALLQLWHTHISHSHSSGAEHMLMVNLFPSAPHMSHCIWCSRISSFSQTWHNPHVWWEHGKQYLIPQQVFSGSPWFSSKQILHVYVLLSEAMITNVVN